MEALLILVTILGAASVHGQTSCTTEGAVRLEGLIGDNGGRVEVCLGGVWGTICGSAAWSQKNAQVACRQLPLGILAYSSILPNTLPESAQATPETPIHYSSYTCNGTERMVSQCPLSTDVSSCDHGNDVAIFCRTSIAEGGDIRLLGDTTNGVGAVEIYEDVISGWRTICPDVSVWNNVTANATCIQLGYDTGIAENFSLPNGTVPVGIGSIGVDGITCEFEDYTLQKCAISYTNTSSCSAAADTYAGVRCQSSDRPDGSLRLFGASSTTEGRVEILYNGRWGAVCNERWSEEDGVVACRQLGENDEFPDTNPFTRDFRGASEVKPIWLSALDCDSTEDSLMDCSRRDRPIGYSSSCEDHSNVAALVCGAEDSGAHGQHATTLPLIYAVVFLLLHLACQ